MTKVKIKMRDKDKSIIIIKKVIIAKTKKGKNVFEAKEQVDKSRQKELRKSRPLR